MNIYIESNFVLELALEQEQHPSCDEIVRLCEAKLAALVLPAYSLIEPWETIARRRQVRKRLTTELGQEFTQLTRSATFAAKRDEFENVRAMLIATDDEETKRLRQVQSRLLSVCDVISLESSTLIAAARYRDLSPQDAIVYASVLQHLENSKHAENCFLNRNSRDFNDPDIVDELALKACKLMFRFDDGLGFIRSRVTKGK